MVGVIGEVAIQIVAVLLTFIIVATLAYRRYGGCVPPLFIAGASSFLVAAVVGRVIDWM